jgi:SAM-dependent MidA family methyltransferase
MQETRLLLPLLSTTDSANTNECLDAMPVDIVKGNTEVVIEGIADLQHHHALCAPKGGRFSPPKSDKRQREAHLQVSSTFHPNIGLKEMKTGVAFSSLQEPTTDEKRRSRSHAER